MIADGFSLFSYKLLSDNDFYTILPLASCLFHRNVCIYYEIFLKEMAIRASFLINYKLSFEAEAVTFVRYERFHTHNLVFLQLCTSQKFEIIFMYLDDKIYSSNF